MTQSIGIIGLSALADHLADCGIKVHTAETARAAAKAVIDAEPGASFPLLVSDHAQLATGLVPWLRSKGLKNHTGVLVQLPLPDGGTRLPSDLPAQRLTAPFSSAELAAVTGLTLPDFTVGPNGNVSASVASPVEDSFDFGMDDPEPEPAPVQEQVDSDWGAPAPAQNDWSVEPPAPAPVVDWATPTPAPSPAPAQDDDWGFAPTTPAPVAPAPVQVAPVTPEPEPAPVAPEVDTDAWDAPDLDDLDIEDSWDTPEPEPTPVVQTPVGFDKPRRETFDGPLGEVIFAWAAKGGVGKSSVAMLIAQRAAEKGLKVILIDGNRGQGDVRKYLRLNTANLPTAYDVASGAAPESAIIYPRALRSNRPDSVDDIDFALVQAPSLGLANSRVVDTGVYSRILETARQRADLVVVDTQIAEEDDTTKLHSELWVPAMAAYAWNLAIADTSPPGVTNLKERITDHEKDGVSKARTLSIINNASQTLDYEEQKLGDYLGEKSTFIGFVKRTATIERELTMGNLPTADPAVVHELDSILYRVTGKREFSPAERSEEAAPTKKGLFSWLRR